MGSAHLAQIELPGGSSGQHRASPRFVTHRRRPAHAQRTRARAPSTARACAPAAPWSSRTARSRPSARQLQRAQARHGSRPAARRRRQRRRRALDVELHPAAGRRPARGHHSRHVARPLRDGDDGLRLQRASRATISRGASGFWIENGEFAFPVSEITVSINLDTMLKNIDAIGNDLDMRTATCAPTIRISSMTIAGSRRPRR